MGENTDSGIRLRPCPKCGKQPHFDEASDSFRCQDEFLHRLDEANAMQERRMRNAADRWNREVDRG